MHDREKVIKEAEEVLEFLAPDDKNRLHMGITVKLGWIYDVLELLKEQETIEPKKVKGYNPPMYTLYEYECKKCKSPMINKQPFCMGCGIKVKWE